MTDETAPVPLSITVYRRDGEWWARVEDERGGVLDDRRSLWDGSGRFYEEGLNAVVGRIPQGYAYQGSGAWEMLPDGSYTATLYRLDPRFL